MGRVSRRFVFLTSFIRRLPGRSQSFLAEANDGLRYVVKSPNHPQEPNLCFNESIGTELFRGCHLPVADWRPVFVPRSFIDSNPGCWMETAEGMLRPAEGLCFGSRFLGGGDRSIFEIIPAAYFGRVSNLNDFWLAWLLDICAGHTDNRQAIFEESTNRALNAVFIDHGHIFGGATGEQQSPSLRASCYLDSRIYQDIPPEFHVTLRRAVANLNADNLWRHVQALPADWRAESPIRSLSRCLDKLASSKIVEDVCNEMNLLYRQMRTRERSFSHPRRKPELSVLCPDLLPTERRRHAIA